MSIRELFKKHLSLPGSTEACIQETASNLSWAKKGKSGAIQHSLLFASIRLFLTLISCLHLTFLDFGIKSNSHYTSQEQFSTNLQIYTNSELGLSQKTVRLSKHKDKSQSPSHNWSFYWWVASQLISKCWIASIQTSQCIPGTQEISQFFNQVLEVVAFVFHKFKRQNYLNNIINC